MNSFLRTEAFGTWLSALKDHIGRARIIRRIRSAEHGNFGDCELGGDKRSQKRDTKHAIEMARVQNKE